MPENHLLYSVEPRRDHDVLSDLLRILFPGVRSLADVSWGGGRFYDGAVPSIRSDGAFRRGANLRADFRALPLRDGAAEVVIFDPPFQPQTTPGVIGQRYTKTAPGIENTRALVVAGAREAWRVARRGIIVKYQDYIHNHQPVWMGLWLRDEIGDPYEVCHVVKRKNLRAKNWRSQRSAWRNHSTFAVWSKERNR